MAQSSVNEEFRPSLSPLILTQGQLEIGNGFNFWLFEVEKSLYSYQSKYQIFGNSTQVTYGVKSFINIGVDYNYLRAGKAILEAGEEFKINFWSTTIGPRIRWSPFQYDKQKRFSISFQHSVLFPWQNSLDEGGNNYYIEGDQQIKQPTFSNQFLFMHGVGQRFVFMFQSDLIILPQVNEDLLRPLRSSSFMYMSWMPNTQLMFFVLTNYVTGLGSVEWADDRRKYFSLSNTIGFGPGIQIGTSNFSWSLSYLHPILNTGYINESISTKTFNTSLRWKIENLRR